jgi:hypothetical protein
LQFVNVLVQRTADQLFWKEEGVWVASKEEATAFSNCSPAINLCIERGMTGVRLWLAFDDPKYDFPMEVFRAETQALIKHNRELREKGRAPLSEIDRAQAEAKERKKQFPFKRDDLGRPIEGPDAVL